MPVRPLTGLAATALALSAGLTGCSDQQETAPPVTRATATIDGTTLAALTPRCERQQQYLSVRAGDRSGEVTGVLDVGGVRPVAEWVKIRDLGGFTGDFWRGGVGGIESVRNDHGTFRLVGTAYGVHTARPHELGQTAHFSIRVEC